MDKVIVCVKTVISSQNAVKNSMRRVSTHIASSLPYVLTKARDGIFDGEGVGSRPWVFSVPGTKRSANMAWTSEGKSRLLNPAPGIDKTSICPNNPDAKSALVKDLGIITGA